MKRSGTVVLALAAAFAIAGCGGGGGSSTPTSPSTSTGTTGGGTGTPAPASINVTIKGDLGQSSFNPNPVPVDAGQVVVFKNTDSITHHIMLDDGSMQTADIPPGGTSVALPIGSANVGFHCTIHPDMVGAFNGGTVEMPPANGCQTGYCLGGGK
jgi:plastocyanin